MILIDANLLIYAYSSRYAEHEAATEWLEGVLNGRDRVGLPWGSTLAFARLVTDRRRYPDAPSLPDAGVQMRRWLSSPVAWVPAPTAEHAALAGRLRATPGLQHNNISNVHLAAIALGHGTEIKSHDADFARFDGLRWSDPLAG